MTGRGAVRCGLAMMLLWLAGAAAEAACTAVAGLPLPYTPAAVGAGMVPPGHVGIRFLGHASFLIASPGGVSIVTDYNAYTRPDDLPDIVTMNHAHSSHYTELPDPGIKLVLRGWNTGNGVADYDITFGDVRVRNVPTNIRDDGALRGDGGTEYGGNSIFVFDVAELCIAHLGHLHHTLTPQHLAQLGPIDVLFAPVDGTWTLGHDDLIEVIEQIRPALVITSPAAFWRRFSPRRRSAIACAAMTDPVSCWRARNCRSARRSSSYPPFRHIRKRRMA
jgi:L-ascorbate metabolism protein UlaG (beta-lactamase superfamily)